MKKIISFLFFFLSLSSFSYAQKRVAFGVSAGSGIYNYQAGLLLEGKLTKRLFLQFESNIFISNKNQDVTIVDTSGNAIGTTRLRVNSSYFQTPLLLKYKLGKVGKLYGLMGISPSFVFNSKLHAGNKNLAVSFNEYLTFDGGTIYAFEAIEDGSSKNSTVNLMKFMKPINIFLTLGMGYEKALPKITPFIETRLCLIPNNTINLSFWQQSVIGTIRGGVKF